jgi:hypothetical protein
MSHIRKYKMKWLLCVLACIAVMLCLGCATSILSGPLEPINLRGHKLGLLILIPEKQVEFFEVKQKYVFGIQTVENYYTFEGSWDPAPVLYEKLVTHLKSDYGLQSIPLWQLADKNAYDKVVVSCETRFNAAREKKQAGPAGTAFGQEHYNSPPIAYLQSSSPAEVRSLGERAGLDLVLEVSISGMVYMTGTTIALDLTSFYLPVYGRLLRLSDGKVLRVAKQWQGGNINHVVYSFHQVEENNLSLLKQDYVKAVEDLLQGESTFLKELLE